MEPVLVQLESIAPCLLHVSHCEGTSSVLFVASLQVLNMMLRPPWAFISHGWKDLPPSVFHQRTASPALWTTFWASFGPFPICPHLFFFFQIAQAVLHVRSDKRWVVWDDHISISADKAPIDAAQDAISIPWSLLTPVQLWSHKVPRSSPARQLQATQISACTGLFGCIVPKAGPGSCLC